MKKVLYTILGSIITTGLLVGVYSIAAPPNQDNITRHLTPEADSTYNIGTSSVRYLGGYFDNLDIYGIASSTSFLTNSATTTDSLHVGGSLTVDGNSTTTGSGYFGGEVWGDAQNMTLARIGNSTYGTVQNLQDIFHSTGFVSGGTITDAGAGKIDIAAGTGLIRDTNSATAKTYYFDWTASSTIDMVNTVNYLGVEYNSGSPRIALRTSYDWNFKTDFPLGNVVNLGGTLHIENSPFMVGDHASNMIQRNTQTAPYARDNVAGGLIIGETGTRNITLSSGAIWQGLNRFTISAVDTSGTDTFATWYYNGSAWVETTGVTQWPNAQYNNIASGLSNLTGNFYSNLWFYLEADGDIEMVYGQNEYATLAQAEAESAPSFIPEKITAQSRLIGRIVFKNGDATAQEIQSSFDTVFSATAASDHGNLAGLADDDHPQYGALAQDETVTGSWTFPNGINASSTTNLFNLNTYGNATTTLSHYMGSLGLNSEYFTDLTGTNLELDTGRLDVVDAPTFTGNVTANEDLYVGNGNATDDDYVYFDAGNEALFWNDGSGRFEFTDDLNVQGTITSVNATSTAIEVFGNTTTTDGYISILNGLPNASFNYGFGDLNVDEKLFVGGNTFMEGNATTSGSIHTGSLRLENSSIYQESGDLTLSGAGNFTVNNSGYALLAPTNYVALRSNVGTAMYLDAGALFTFRDRDGGYATIATLDSSNGNLYLAGSLGIGNSSPTNKISVYSTANSSGVMVSPSTSRGGLFLSSDSLTRGHLSGGAELTGSDATAANAWTARGNTAAHIFLRDGIIQFMSDGGLTAGNTYTPTEVMRILSTGVVGFQGIPGASWTTKFNILNTGTSSGLRINSGTGENGLALGSSGSTSGTVLAGAEMLLANPLATNGLMARSSASSGTIYSVGDTHIYGNSSLTVGAAFTANTRLFVGSGGDIGIGDITPDGKLEVRQTGTADILNLYDNTTNVFTVLDGGNVGIGDTTPSALLTVGNGDLFTVDSSGVVTARDLYAGYEADTSHAMVRFPNNTYAGNAHSIMLFHDGSGFNDSLKIDYTSGNFEFSTNVDVNGDVSITDDLILENANAEAGVIFWCKDADDNGDVDTGDECCAYWGYSNCLETGNENLGSFACNSDWTTMRFSAYCY